MDKTKEIHPSSLSLSYSEVIRSLLDVVDKLQNLKVMKEGIQLPNIVVVGGQSSGKSSVLESLSGISLPRGNGICTRVPLIMRLQNSIEQNSRIVVEYNDKKQHITETQITDTINSVTEEIAGTNKGISHVPISLHVRKMNAPDLTLVDLPGITTVPSNGQPEDIYEQISKDIYEQISKIIMEYITPKESIILNVLSAIVDFPTCESIRMSQRVDEHGERTLGVVTKVDMAPEGLSEKLNVDAVNIGLGYVCVRNRVGDESNEEAREAEAELFRSHTQLNKIDEAMVGIPMLARRLLQIQAKSISRCFPDIVKNIEDALSQRQSELSSLPQHVSDPMEAMVVFLRLMNGLKDCLNRLLIEGDYSEFLEETGMHGTARLKEMFEGFYNDIVHMNVEDKKDFLVEEAKMLEECKGAGLSNFFSRSVFKNLLRKRIDEVLKRGLSLTAEVWDYVEKLVLGVIHLKFRNYPQLETATRRAFQLLVSKRKEGCIHYVNQVAEMEKSLDFTLNPSCIETWTELLQQKDQFMQELSKIAEGEPVATQPAEPSIKPQLNFAAAQPFSNSQFGFGLAEPSTKPLFNFGPPEPFTKTSHNKISSKAPAPPPVISKPLIKKTVNIKGFGEVDVKEVMNMPKELLSIAFEMKASVNSYWKVVVQRVGDGIPQYLQFVYQNLVRNDVDGEIMKDVTGSKLNIMEKILEENPLISSKRKSLKRSIDSLVEAQSEISKIMDQIAEIY